MLSPLLAHGFGATSVGALFLVLCSCDQKHMRVFLAGLGRAIATLLTQRRIKIILPPVLLRVFRASVKARLDTPRFKAQAMRILILMLPFAGVAFSY